MAVLPNWLLGFAGTMSAGGPMSLFWGYVSYLIFICIDKYNHIIIFFFGGEKLIIEEMLCHGYHGLDRCRTFCILYSTFNGRSLFR